MKIIRVEPTPSPNSMKLTLDERLNPGVRLDYKRGEEGNAPSYIKKLLGIPGVTGIYQTADFLALERHPKGDWQSILAAAEAVMGVGTGGDGRVHAGPAGGQEESPLEKGFGEVGVLVQTFRGIPMQVRVSAGLEERRAALPQRFLEAASTAGLASPNLIMERKLEDRGVRYGELAEVLEEVVRELDAAYDDARLQELVLRSRKLGEAGLPETPAAVEETTRAGSGGDPAAALADPDWRKRYAAVERLKPGADTLPLLLRARKDEHPSVRRLAVVYMGDIREPDTLPYLLEALEDPSPIIRRTAGDTLSDRGDPKAAPAMEKALADPNKLVRWRAARFLYEVGDETSLPSLAAAKDDPEFEIRLQVRLAIERIEGGEAAQGTVWQQMTRRNDGAE